MKLLRLIAVAYKPALSKIQKLINDSPGLTYNQLMSSVSSQGILYGSGFVQALRNQGFDAIDILSDVASLQNLWVKENRPDLQTNGSNTSNIDTLLAQIESIRPDILFFQDTLALPYEIRKSLKLRYPFIKKILIFKGFPHGMNQLADADLVFSGIPYIHKLSIKLGIPSRLMYHSFDFNMIDFIQKPETRVHKLSFAGSSGVGYEMHKDRYQLISQCLSENLLSCWLDEPASITQVVPQNSKFSFNKITLKQFIKEFLINITEFFSPRQIYNLLNMLQHDPRAKKILQEAFDERVTFGRTPFNKLYKKIASVKAAETPKIPLQKIFPNQVNSAIFGIEMLTEFKKSFSILNKHTEAAFGEVGNMRMFEATAAGACVLTDHGKNINDLFEPDHEIITFKSTSEAISKARYLFKNPNEALKVGERGQKKLLFAHTSKNRAQLVSETIKSII